MAISRSTGRHFAMSLGIVVSLLILGIGWTLLIDTSYADVVIAIGVVTIVNIAIEALVYEDVDDDLEKLNDEARAQLDELHAVNRVPPKRDAMTLSPDRSNQRVGRSNRG